MEALEKFITQHGVKVIILLLLAIFLRQGCTNSSVDSVEKELETLNKVAHLNQEIVTLLGTYNCLTVIDRTPMMAGEQQRILNEIKQLQAKRDQLLTTQPQISESKEK